MFTPKRWRYSVILPHTYLFFLFDKLLYICDIADMKLLKQEDKRYKIDYSKPVRVYKNLNKGCWSIQQNGLVKAYSDEINLFNCEFLVNQKNRQRVIKTKRKNVHAFVRGYIWDTPIDLIKQVSYNPYVNWYFYDTNDLVSVHKAHFVRGIDGKLFYN